MDVGGAAVRLRPRGRAQVWDVCRPEDASLRRRLVAFARRFVFDQLEAEDIVQEALLRAGRASQVGQVRPDRPEAWLFQVCRHVAIDHVRARRARHHLWAPLAEGMDRIPSTDSLPLPARLPPFRFDPCLLVPQHRLLLALYHDRGFGQKVLCGMTGLRASALRVRLFRARLTLREGRARALRRPRAR